MRWESADCASRAPVRVAGLPADCREGAAGHGIWVYQGGLFGRIIGDVIKKDSEKFIWDSSGKAAMHGKVHNAQFQHQPCPLTATEGSQTRASTRALDFLGYFTHALKKP
eukprot:1157570-Pelagomonas_calceolata.AAC.20